MDSLVTSFIRHALIGVEKLPPTQRADQYEGAAILLRPHSEPESAAAMKTALALREAEALQLHFKNLFTDEGRAA